MLQDSNVIVHLYIKKKINIYIHIFVIVQTTKNHLCMCCMIFCLICQHCWQIELQHVWKRLEHKRKLKEHYGKLMEHTGKLMEHEINLTNYDGNMHGK